jgi:2-polyprenyl-3-methyl-5-hydroxy-6-metoxy-1,4-benzoquinol methylase
MKLENRDSIRTRPQPICILCSTGGESLHHDLSDRLFGVPGAWHLKQCPSCGLAWLDPTPVEADIGKLYLRYSTHIASTVHHSIDNQSFAQRVTDGLLAEEFGYRERAPDFWAGLAARFAAHSRFLTECIGMSVSWLDGGQRGRLLDVGSGNGEFLARMRGLGWNVVGIEPDLTAAQVSRDTYGLTIYSGSLERVDLSAQPFDAMTLMHVIEHLSDPMQTLRSARDLLRKGGRLVILTPNIASLGHRWFRDHWRGLEPPRHLFLFSTESLRRLVENAGFHVLDCRKNAIAADSMWRLSAADKHGLNVHDLPTNYAGWSATLFMIFEHVLTGWPFYRSWGEQLALTAIRD